MSITLPNLGGTLTGGSSVTLNRLAASGDKVTYVTSNHTRLHPQTVDLLTTVAKTTAKDPGVAKSAVRLTFADRQTEEGCCTVNAGLVAFDINGRWHLNQPESLVDDAIDYLRSVVMSPGFKALLISGVFPD